MVHQLVGGIKVLLHEQGMTIKGVQTLLKTEGPAHVAALSPPLDGLDDEDGTADELAAWDRELADGAVEDAEIVEGPAQGAFALTGGAEADGTDGAAESSWNGISDPVPPLN